MKATQTKAEEDATESRPAGGKQQPMVNIDDVLRQIIREEFAAGDEQ